MKMTKDVEELVREIFELSIRINSELKYDCFFELKPHVEWVEVRIAYSDKIDWLIDEYISTKREKSRLKALILDMKKYLKENENE